DPHATFSRMTSSHRHVGEPALQRPAPLAVSLNLPTPGTLWQGTAFLRHNATGETQMHKDEVKGAAKEARGHVKDAVGKATGDSKLRADGAADKVEGKVQKAAG